MVVPVVVEVEDSVELGVSRDVDFFRVFDAFAEGLTGVLFHLDVVKLSERKRREIKNEVKSNNESNSLFELSLESLSKNDLP